MVVGLRVEQLEKARHYTEIAINELEKLYSGDLEVNKIIRSLIQVKSNIEHEIILTTT